MPLKSATDLYSYAVRHGLMATDGLSDEGSSTRFKRRMKMVSSLPMRKMRIVTGVGSGVMLGLEFLAPAARRLKCPIQGLNLVGLLQNLDLFVVAFRQGPAGISSGQ
jgi:hypothetical protein